MKKKERKKEFRGKEERKKKKSSAGFKLVRLVLLVFLSVKWEAHCSLLFSLQSSSSASFCSPLGL